MTLGPDQRFDWKPPQIISKIHLIRAQVSSEFLRRKCTNFKNRGGYAANRRTRADCSDWMELCMERETGSAASEHAFGVQTAAGEGHRRSLLSCSPLGWGRLGRSVGNESANFRELLAAAESAATPRAPNISKRMCRISGPGQVLTSHA